MGTTTAPERKWLASDRFRRILHPRSATQILQMQVFSNSVADASSRTAMIDAVMVALSACRAAGPPSTGYRRRS